MKKPVIACLIDGEHYLSNTAESLRTLEKHYRISQLIFIGGTEKIGVPSDVKKALPYPVEFAAGPDAPDYEKLGRILKKSPVEMVLDLSDEPVVSYTIRMELATVILYHGKTYRGADFEFQPLRFKKIFKKPSLAIWGTGKRIGKTAIGSFVARVLKKAGHKPGVITLSRGGPSKPIVVRGDRLKIDTQYLLGRDAAGFHAASDCFQDALMGGVPTFGCRRCGGGMAGRPFVTVVDSGARMAEKAPYVKSVILEGSGASLPEIKTDKVILLMDASQPMDILGSFLTPLRIRYADFIMITMCEDFMAKPAKISQIIKRIRQINPRVRIATTVLRPYPLSPIKGKRVFMTTTAPKEALPFLKKHLEKSYGCKVMGMSGNLSVRPQLIKDLKAMKNVDLVLTELKAASVAVVLKEAKKRGLEAALLDNAPLIVQKGGDVKNLEKEVLGLLK